MGLVTPQECWFSDSRKILFQNQSICDYLLLISTMRIPSSLAWVLGGVNNHKMQEAAQETADSQLQCLNHKSIINGDGLSMLIEEKG